ncbi:hypothetical protein HMPREF9004_1134 [Schaalia cardiffensis F0333]|uniref:Uncharacterized protein n=1 Tax=Schaalia cardiffensis F0333 TaxID=888050 RepID=N6XAD2_9ACTO|nr:hypothetical protein HMPREF9004_1134 [Schaalia cardiffensis F0333]
MDRIGSSPLTRGARRFPHGCHETGGLIPAHAGSTVTEFTKRLRLRTHPRSRGEHVMLSRMTLRPTGSSPLTRGAPRTQTHMRRRMRLIPAHAGSTTIAPSDNFLRGAHPRSRGEHSAPVILSAPIAGSSPLTRGARRFPHGCHETGGLIPAHAGSTRRHRRGPQTRWAHPRSRGEHFRMAASSACVTGSSPLTRGAPQTLDDSRNCGGLIPAHAGSTNIDYTHRASSTAHPRSRGEHLRCNPLLLRSDGSSPLTRGAPATAQYDARLPGLIPAHAGST